MHGQLCTYQCHAPPTPPGGRVGQYRGFAWGFVQMPLYSGINLGANPRGVPVPLVWDRHILLRNIHSKITRAIYTPIYTHITALQMPPPWGSVDRSNPPTMPLISPPYAPGGVGGA